MTLTSQLDLGSVKVYQQAKYLGQIFESFSSSYSIDTHTKQMDCSSWTTKWVSNKDIIFS